MRRVLVALAIAGLASTTQAAPHASAQSYGSSYGYGYGYGYQPRDVAQESRHRRSV